MPIEGKVAGIINERDLIINKGSDVGVSEGMKFRVVEGQVPIKDPDSGEELGCLDREKIRVRVVEVQAKFCIAKTYETYVVNIGGEGVSFGFTGLDSFRRLLPRQEVTRVRTLRAADTINLGPMPMDEVGSFVKVGDSVKQVVDDV